MYKEGDIVQDLKLESSDGEVIEVGKGKWIVLYFYPKDNTPGCTVQAQTFSKLKQEFENQKAEVIGISKDSNKSHEKFIQNCNLKIKLVSDKAGQIAKLFGVQGKIFFSRDTVLIDPNGKIVKIWRKASAQNNPLEVLELIKHYNQQK
ncbi:MAG: peroxiredoxin [bacterium]